MKPNLPIMCLACVPDIVRLGDLNIVRWKLPLTCQARALTCCQTNVSCRKDGYRSARKSELQKPINYLERSSVIHEFESGCSIVAAWKGSAIYLCHEVCSRRRRPSQPAKLINRARIRSPYHFKRLGDWLTRGTMPAGPGTLRHLS